MAGAAVDLGMFLSRDLDRTNRRDRDPDHDAGTAEGAVGQFEGAVEVLGHGAVDVRVEARNPVVACSLRGSRPWSLMHHLLHRLLWR